MDTFAKEAYLQALQAISELKRDYNTWMNFFLLLMVPYY